MEMTAPSSDGKKKKKPFKPKIGKGDYGFTDFIGTAVGYKSSWQAEACGTVDELNTLIGEAHARIENAEVKRVLMKISKELFVLGADIATSIMTEKDHLPRITTARVHRIEELIVQYELFLSPIRNFVLPMGPPSVTILNQARAVCRRAERQMVRFLKDDSRKAKQINPLTLAYLNRLGDLLFSMARFMMKESGTPEIYWSREDAKES
jgi:cob(I)alamin adenosyltransferase